MNDKQRDRPQDDAFTGYHLRGMEEALARVEALTRGTQALLWRLDRKLDALGTSASPADMQQAIAAINAETAKVTEASAALADVTDQLNKTGV